MRSTPTRHTSASGEFRAEPLTEIISRDEVDLLPHWDAKGTLSIKKGRSKTAMPSGPEQLRLRLTVLQNARIMIQLRHPNRQEQAIKKDMERVYKIVYAYFRANFPHWDYMNSLSALVPLKRP